LLIFFKLYYAANDAFLGYKTMKFLFLTLAQKVNIVTDKIDIIKQAVDEKEFTEWAISETSGSDAFVNTLLQRTDNFGTVSLHCLLIYYFFKAEEPKDLPTSKRKSLLLPRAALP
jgi:hypothetical protein